MTIKIRWTQKDSNRFDSYVNEDPVENGCWEWTGGRLLYGYGRFWLNGRTIGAHVFAFVREHGFRPPVVRHSCDNPWCVNPAHLLPGTAQDNALDARERGRIVRTKRIKKKQKPGIYAEGRRNGRAVLIKTQILEIRRRYAEEGRTSLRLLASEYRVSKTLIQRIIQGLVWRHI